MDTVALEEVAKIDRTVASEYDCEVLPYVGLEHIEKDSGHFSINFKRCPETLLATKFKFTSSHVLYGKLRPYLNKVALPNFEGVCTTEILPILPNTKKLDKCFLWLTLLSPKFVAWATKSVSGANLPRLDPKELAEFQILLPPIDEQKRIAAIAQKCDRIRRIRRSSQRFSETYLQSILLEMFGDPIVNPKEWKKYQLRDLCRIRRGASPRPIDDYLGGTVPWIKIGDGAKGDGLYLSSTRDFVTKEGSQKSVYLEPGSLIFANCGVSLGFARILKIAGCIHDGWLAFDEIDSRLNQIFLLRTLNHLTPFFRDLAPDGTQPNLNTGIVGDFRLILPPLALQVKFAQVVQIFERIRIQQREADRQAEHLFQTVLDRAFKGKL